MSIGPIGNLDDLQVRFALEAAAAAAPSSGGGPWRFRCTDLSIELFSERGAPGRMSGPGGRAVRLQCGAALLNLRLAIRTAGIVPEVRLLPDPRRPDLIASVGCTALAGPMAATERRLVEVLHPAPAGHPAGGPLPAALVGDLRAAARTELAWLSEITEITEITGENDSPFGEPPRPASPGGSSLLVSVGSLTDLPLDHVTAGQATQRVLLTARSAGWNVGPVPGFVEVDAARLALRRRLGGGLWPQSVLGLGYRSARAQPAAASTA